jgi:hypothetical protein
MRRFNKNAILAITACLGLVLSACGGMEGNEEGQRGGFGGKADSTGQFCGGIAGIPCPEGYKCKLDGDYPDAGGECVAEGGQFCGGIAGIQCPVGYKCKLDGDYPDAGGTCVKVNCSPVMCELYCEHGFQTDENGCQICKCKPAPCLPVMCGLYCEFGYQKDENGCDLCKCKPAPCLPVMCELYCENGFQTDENGCEICKCKAPERKVASGACVKNSFDSCTTDADCVAGGCGGELCYNPTFGGGASTCECVQPTGVSCGCVNGKCAWWN